jgi:hypothetical protein
MVVVKNTFVSVALLIAASASWASSPVSTKNLAPVTSNQCITITHGMSYSHVTGKSIFKHNGEFRIEPGVYKAAYEDAEGTYFSREGYSVWVGEVGGNKANIYVGGIWVPKAQSVSSSVFIFSGFRPQRVNDARDYVEGANAAAVNGDTTYNPQANQAQTKGIGVVPGSVGGAIGYGIVNALAKPDTDQIIIFNDSVGGFKDALPATETCSQTVQ